jgi:hypothetical protein
MSRVCLWSDGLAMRPAPLSREPPNGSHQMRPVARLNLHWSRSAPVGRVEGGTSIRKTIGVELPPDLDARLFAAAEERRLPVEEVVKAFLYNFHALRGRKGTLAEEIDRGFEEAADLIPEVVRPVSD